MTYSNRRCSHPEFKWSALDGAAPIVFCFDRSRYKEPSDEQLAKYDKSEAIVKSLGGDMRAPRWQIAGENAPFSEVDIAAMKETALSENPDLEFHSQWNGAGCYTFSLGLRDRVTPDKSEMHGGAQ